MTTQPSPLRFLLVDDEAYFRLFVGKVLSNSVNCVVTERKNGQEAIAYCQTNDLDLIVLDINMPRMDGVQALAQIRVLKPVVPIVMLTSVSEEAVVEQCVTLGASYFIRKDVRGDQLKAELEEMLQMFFPTRKATHERPQAPAV